QLTGVAVVAKLPRRTLARQLAQASKELVPGVIYLNDRVMLRVERNASFSSGEFDPRPMGHLDIFTVRLDGERSEVCKVDIGRNSIPMAWQPHPERKYVHGQYDCRRNYGPCGDHNHDRVGGDVHGPHWRLYVICSRELTATWHGALE